MPQTIPGVPIGTKKFPRALKRLWSVFAAEQGIHGYDALVRLVAAGLRTYGKQVDRSYDQWNTAQKPGPKPNGKR